MKELIEVDLIRKMKHNNRPDSVMAEWAQNGWNAAIDHILAQRKIVMADAEWQEWEEGEGVWVCSNCGEDVEHPTEYCPYCGASMTNIMDALDAINPVIPPREDKWDKADRVYYDKVRDTEDDPRW